MDDDSGSSDIENLLEEEEQIAFHNKPSYVLFAIDTHPSMFIPNKANKTPFKECLEACFAVSDSMVLSDGRSMKSPLGIVLAAGNTDKSNFVNFEQPIPASVIFLRKIIKQPESELKDLYLRACTFDLADFFLLCKNKFVQINAQAYKRTIVYITNNDDPVLGDAKKRFCALNEAKTFTDLNMSLEVITMNGNFNCKTFYNELLSVSGSPQVEEVEDLSQLTDKLASFLQVKYAKYRSHFFPFKNDQKRFLQIIINGFITEARFTSNISVTRDTHKIVKKSRTQDHREETYEFQYALNEPPLVFNQAQKESLEETKFPCGFSLLYVSNKISKLGHVVESPSLIQVDPKETLEFFDIFWQYCVDKSKVFVCMQKLKRNGSTKFVELSPTFVNGIRMFLVSVLPTKDDIQYVTQVPAHKIEITLAQAEATKNLIDALSFDYYPNMFTDPQYTKQKAYIRSELLEQPMEEVLDVCTNDDKMDKLIDAQVQQFKKVFCLDMATGTKRKGTDEDGSKSKK